MRRILIAICSWVIAISAFATDVHFDYTSFDNPNTPGITPHFGQAQFNVLNYPSINGNYMMTSTDMHRPEMTANNNALAEFYNNFLADYNTQYRSTTGLDAIAEADAINSYTNKNSTKTGSRPNWMILNEISASVWPDISQKGTDYRKWVIDVVTRLHDTYGYDVVTYSPFANPGNNAADWQALAAKSYIGVENYLSGEEVMSHGTDYASRKTWAQAQYAWSKTAFGNLGVASSRLFLGEEFANTVSGTAWGRAGLSASDWDTVIQIRQDAILGAGYTGFLAYAWGSNGMGITEAEQIQHEYWYRTRLVLPGQQPQWLSDTAINVNGTTIPLNWNEQLNWLGGVPNAPAAVANFFRTNTAARTITLDGSQTVGSMSFNSSFGYTIAPGSGGSITLNNSGAGAGVVVPVGTHAINVPVALADNVTFNVTGALSLGAGLTNNSGRSITKTGGGTLTITGTQSHSAGATFTASDGVTNLNSNANGNLALIANSTVNFGSAQNLSSLTIAANKKVTVASGGSNALRVGSLSISGQLDLNDNPAIVDYGGSSPLATIRGLIKTGYNNGSWNGNGIMSTLAQTSSPKAAIGYAEASDMFSTFPATYAGQSIDSTTVLMRYTVMGDTDFNGKANILDFNSLAANFGKTNMSWRQGDFNYDGTVDIQDFNLLAASFGQNAPANAAPFGQFLNIASDNTTSIPLPAPVYLGAVGLACAFVATWKFRRS